VTLAADDTVDRIRARINELDEALVATINERLEIVAELFRHKLAHGLPLHDPGREAWLRRHLAESNAGPLSADGVERLCTFVLDLTKEELARD